MSGDPSVPWEPGSDPGLAQGITAVADGDSVVQWTCPRCTHDVRTEVSTTQVALLDDGSDGEDQAGTWVVLQCGCSKPHARADTPGNSGCGFYFEQFFRE